MNTNLTYPQALKLVMSLADFERSTHSPGHSAFHLERMSLLMQRLDNAHLDTPTVHIAGTKGKGSVSAMIASILAAQGYGVGMYSSPHLHSATERIRVNMQPIPKPQFAAVAQRIWHAVEQVGAHGGYGGVTTFEALTAMAFTHFSQIQANFQVIEVGLGGRLDATNIVSPQACAITSISLDHTATLGDTIAQIAYEKAGVIKPNIPVIVAPQPADAMAVIRRIAAERNAPLLPVADRLSWQQTRRQPHPQIGVPALSQAFRLTTPRRAYALETPLLGDYQLENAAVAVAVAETLAEQGVTLSPQSIAQGIRTVNWPARLQILAAPDEGSGAPLLVVDGAHNPYSIERLAQTLPRHFAYDRIILIFGALSGHSAAGMLQALVPLSPTLIATGSRHPRSAAAATIAQTAAQIGITAAFASDNVAQATRRALAIARPNDLVLGTGSLSVAAEITEEIQAIPPETYPYINPPRANNRHPHNPLRPCRLCLKIEDKPTPLAPYL